MSDPAPTATPGPAGGRPEAAPPSRGVWPPLLCGAVLVLLLWWTWRRWLDPVIDFGHELYVPWRLANGEVLYRDLYFTMGPASQYFHALLFRLFGPGVMVLVAANVLILVGMMVLVWRLVRRLADRVLSTLVVLFLVVVFGFCQEANYNYVCPYRHEMTHGLAALLLLLECLIRQAEQPRRWRWWLIGGLCGLAILLKSEIGVAALGLTAAGALWLTGKGQPRDQVLPTVGGFAGGLLLPNLFFLGLLARNLSWTAAAQGIYGNWAYAWRPELTTGYPFYQRLMGLDDVAGNLWAGTLRLAAMATVVGLLTGLTYLAGQYRRDTAAPAWGAGVIALAAGHWGVPRLAWLNLPQAFPVVGLAALGGFGWAAWRQRRDPTASRSYYVLALWAVLALALVPKRLLSLWFGHYGFVLAMPLGLLVLYLAIAWWPGYVQRRWGVGRLLRGGMMGLALACALASFERAANHYRARTSALGQGRDRFYYDVLGEPRYFLLPRLVETLEGTLPPDATLLVLPEGITFNYLLRHRNPTPYHLLTPWEMSAFGGEDVVLRGIAAHPPDCIVLLSLDMSEHGRHHFGETGYGDCIVAWMRGEYVLQRALTAKDAQDQPCFQALIWRRSAAPPGSATP